MYGWQPQFGGMGDAESDALAAGQALIASGGFVGPMTTQEQADAAALAAGQSLLFSGAFVGPVAGTSFAASSSFSDWVSKNATLLALSVASLVGFLMIVSSGGRRR